MHFFAYYSTVKALSINRNLNFFAKTYSLYYLFANYFFIYLKKNDGQFSYFILKTSLFEKDNHAKSFAKICNFKFLQIFCEYLW